jgi:hypothetical protein
MFRKLKQSFEDDLIQNGLITPSESERLDTDPDQLNISEEKFSGRWLITHR